jgi:hypothetical protein
VRSADRIAGAALLALAVAFSAGALKEYTLLGRERPRLGVPAVLARPRDGGARGDAARRRAARSDPGPAWLPSGDGLRRLALVVGASAAFVALLNVIGMTIGTVLFLVVLMRFLDRQSWPVTIAVALAVAA